ncbi:hypothetical protein GQ457_12G027660 [Hibiscus cannabinus]
MVDGVLTRHQAAQLAIEAQSAQTEQTQPLTWQQETNRLQSEINQEVSQLKTDISQMGDRLEAQMADMRTSILTEIHKVITIALGKAQVSETVEVANQETVEGTLQAPGLLGAQPRTGLEPQATTVGVQLNANLASGSNPIGKSNVVLIDDEIRNNSLSSIQQPNNLAYKLMCPKFDGEDFKGWLSKLEQYFEAEKVPEGVKVRLVMLHLEGKALQWNQLITRGKGDLNQWDWNQYLSLLRERFAPGGFEDPFAELVALRQTDTVDQFYEEFIVLLNQVRLPDDYVLSIFKNHLRLEISQFLKLLEPKTLTSAYHMAKHLENIFFPGHKKTGSNTGRYNAPTSILVPPRSINNSFKGNVGGNSGMVHTSKSNSPVLLSPTNNKGVGMCKVTDILNHGGRGDEEGEHEEFMDCVEEVEVVGQEGTKAENPVISLQAMWGETNCDTMRIQIQIGGERLIALVDSGSSHNFISLSAAKKLGLGIDKQCLLRVMVANGEVLKTVGGCNKVNWMIQGESFITDFLVIPLKSCDVVLEVQWLAALGCINWNFIERKMEFQQGNKRIILRGVSPEPLELIDAKSCCKMLKGSKGPYNASLWILNAEMEVKGVKRETRNMEILLQSFQDVFEEPRELPPMRGQEHKIALMNENEAVKVKPYRYPAHQKDEIERLIKEMLTAGIIGDSSSCFSSPIVMVKKKDGSWRMCVDYRRLNQVTIKDKFPMPVIEELLDELGAANYFSKLDLRSGYHQIRMRKEDIHKTAFRTHEGHYEFLVMPFGLTNAPTTFQNLMNKVFKEVLRKYVLVFFDDILVYSKDWESHLKHLEEVLRLLRKNQLYAKRSKCCFGATEVDYLGFVISEGSIKMDQSKVKYIEEWPPPTSVKELRGFLGLSGYYRRFVKGYGCIARPLTDLLKKGAWKWGQTEEIVFNQLKKAIISAPVLALPDFNAEFVVETDASDVGVGAVLVQKGRPLAFFSRGLGIRHQGL